MALWDDLGTLFAKGATTALGAQIAGNANTQAAQIAANASLQGAQIGADAITQGNQEAQQTLNTVRTEAAPATAYLQGVVASPGTLTPQQQAGLAEERLGVANQIHNSNFAGSGRTASALFRKSEADYINDALTTNSQRALTAAGQLNSGATQAATGVANSEAATGNNVGKLYDDATTRAGIYTANATTANGKLSGQAIGDIGSQIANEQRASRYGDYTANVNSRLGTTNP